MQVQTYSIQVSTALFKVIKLQLQTLFFTIRFQLQCTNTYANPFPVALTQNLKSLNVNYPI